MTDRDPGAAERKTHMEKTAMRSERAGGERCVHFGVYRKPHSMEHSNQENQQD